MTDTDTNETTGDDETVEYKTMRVPAAAWDTARDAKHDGETWGDYLLRCADSPAVLGEEDVDALADAIAERLQERD